MNTYNCIKKFCFKSQYTSYIENTSIFENENDFEIIYNNKLVKNISYNIFIPKPFLKWIGEKTDIIEQLIINFPTEINNYHEPFLGGGSILFALLSYIKDGKIKIYGNIYASDLNQELIYTYKNLQNFHNELYNDLLNIITDFNECSTKGEINRNPLSIEEAKWSKENYYYWIRKKYNNSDKKTILASAMFIFLNKTCFKGIFRIGPKGFNVPYGNYNYKHIIDKKHLDEIHSLIKDVIFQCNDFNTSLKNIQKNDFIYIDPPYPSEISSFFIKYTKENFNLEHHSNLFNLIHSLTNSNIKIIITNADVTLVRENFSSQKYNICKCTNLNTINEIIIKNY